MATTLPSPPFISIEGTNNFRDIGDNTHIRRGLVYRSADPSKTTPAGLQKLGSELGITTIFDLRSSPEITRETPSLDPSTSNPYSSHNITRKWTPVFATKDYGPEKVALRYALYAQTGTAGFVQAYRDILLAAPEAYTQIFRHLSQKSPSPCLVHCTAGKDRTGVLVALLFLLCGVEKGRIAEEYSLTNLGLGHLDLLARVMQNPALKGNEEGARRMVESKRENMEATVDMIEEEFGGAEEYMREQCDMSQEEIERLRANLTDVARGRI